MLLVATALATAAMYAPSQDERRVLTTNCAHHGILPAHHSVPAGFQHSTALLSMLGIALCSTHNITKRACLASAAAQPPPANQCSPRTALALRDKQNQVSLPYCGSKSHC